MVRVRTIFGLQEKYDYTLDGYVSKDYTEQHCWMDGDGNLYGGMFTSVGNSDSTVTRTYNEDGSITITRQNEDRDEVRLIIEEQVGKSLRMVSVSGVFPQLTVKGYGWSPEDNPPKHWYHNETLRKMGNRYDFAVMPLVIPKKYANKMKVKEVNMEKMTQTVKAELMEVPWGCAE